MATNPTQNSGKFVRIRYSPVALQLGDVPVAKLSSCFNWENRKDFPPLNSMPWACLEPTTDSLPATSATANAEDVRTTTQEIQLERVPSAEGKSELPLSIETPAEEVLPTTRAAPEQADEALVHLPEVEALQEETNPVESPKAASASDVILENVEPIAPSASPPAREKTIPANSGKLDFNLPAERVIEPPKTATSRIERATHASEMQPQASKKELRPEVKTPPQMAASKRVDTSPLQPVVKPDNDYESVNVQSRPTPIGDSRPSLPLLTANTPPLLPSRITPETEVNADYLASLERLVLQLNYELGVVTGKANSEQWMVQRLIEVNLQNLALQEKLRAVTSQ